MLDASNMDEKRLEEAVREYAHRTRHGLSVWDMIMGRRTPHLTTEEFSAALPERQLPALLSAKATGESEGMSDYERIDLIHALMTLRELDKSGDLRCNELSSSDERRRR